MGFLKKKNWSGCDIAIAIFRITSFYIKCNLYKTFAVFIQVFQTFGDVKHGFLSSYLVILTFSTCINQKDQQVEIITYYGRK